MTYFGCLSCAADRTCPPVKGWPTGQQVTVRELMGLSSPWYFNVVPTDVESTEKVRLCCWDWGAKWAPKDLHVLFSSGRM